MARVLLVINCQIAPRYQNRGVLQSLYGARFDELAFAIDPTCSADPAYRNIICRNQPAPLRPDTRCPCGDQSYGDHSLCIHTFHPRFQYVAEMAADHNFIVFVEDDCILSPHISSDWVERACSNFDALIPGLSYCRPSDTSWVWSKYALEYSSRDEIKNYFNGSRLQQHWREFSGAVLPSAKETPMFAGLADCLILRTSLLTNMLPDLAALEHLWHEIAIPTAVVHHTGRIGLTKGMALWGEDRNRSLEELMSMLRTSDWVHPIKLSKYSSTTVIQAYQEVADTTLGARA